MLLALTLSGEVAAPARILDGRNWLALNLSHDREAGFGERVCYLVGDRRYPSSSTLCPNHSVR
jgi:hypothetical protein